MKAALDLGAVDEAVDVTGVNGLSVFGTSAFTHYRDDQTPSLAMITDKQTQCKKWKVLISVNLLDRVHCRAHTASGLPSPPPSCLEDKRSHRSYHPPQNELQGGRKEMLINFRRN